MLIFASLFFQSFTHRSIDQDATDDCQEVAKRFESLSLVIAVQSCLFLILGCLCCNLGKMRAKTYDKLFIAYLTLLAISLATLVWASALRFGEKSKPCIHNKIEVTETTTEE